MVLSHGKSTTSQPRSSCEKLVRSEFTRQYLIVFRTMKYFMQASYKKTGRKNGANIWMTSEQSIFRTEPLQNTENDTLRCIIFGAIRNKWKEDPQKSRPDYHQTTRAIVRMNKEADQIQESKRRHNYREDLDPEKLDWLKGLLGGKPNLRFKVHTMTSPKNQQKRMPGKPTIIH